jgi:hypothetical protein
VARFCITGEFAYFFFRERPMKLPFSGKIAETEMQVKKDSNATRSSPPMAAKMNVMQRSAFKQGSAP